MDKIKVEQFCLSSFMTNCYVVYNENTKNAFIVDAPLEIDKINSFVRQKQLNIAFVLITHGHADHILGLDGVDYPFYIHKEDKDFLYDSNLNLSALFGASFKVNKEAKILNDSIVFNGEEIKVIHTPGHSPGSVCFLLGDYLFSGDTLFSESIGRTDFVYGNYDQIISSIKNKLICLDGSLKVYPGHGGLTTINHERKNNPFLI